MNEHMQHVYPCPPGATMSAMDAVQHVDAVTRRVEPLGEGWVLSLSRVVPGVPRTVWPHWQQAVASTGARADELLDPEGWRGSLEVDGVTSWVAADLARDGGQTVLTVQHALPAGVVDGPQQDVAAALVARGLVWDRLLWGLGRAVEAERGELEDVPAREDEAADAASELWRVAARQAGIHPR
ncbi:hypothetical protein [Kytococcus schroeteri]|nr:hypothetical protein [Kytococcus schroeteri]